MIFFFIRALLIGCEARSSLCCCLNLDLFFQICWIEEIRWISIRILPGDMGSELILWLHLRNINTRTESTVLQHGPGGDFACSGVQRH